MPQWVGMLAVAAWVTYSSWVLAFLLHTSLDPIRAWVSELGAAGQPHHLVYRFADRISGGLFVLAGMLLVMASRRWRPSRQWKTLGGLTVLGGANLLVEAFNALPCAPSLDQTCLDRLLSTDPTLAEQFHAAASLVGTTALIGSLALSWWIVRHRRGPAWWGLGGLIVASAIGETMSGLALWQWTGLVQRAALAGMALSGVWCVVWLGPLARQSQPVEASG